MKEESCSTCPSKSACAGGCERSDAEMAEMYDLDADTTEGHMVWVELEHGEGVPKVSEVSLELLSKAKRFGDQRVIAVAFGRESVREIAPVLYSHGADTVYHVRNPSLIDFHLPTFAHGLTTVVERVRPNTLLMGATDLGTELAATVAWQLKVGLTADCTGLDIERGVLRMTRPTFGGNLMATIVSEGRPQMATVRPGAFPVEEIEEGRRGTLINWPIKMVEGTVAEQVSDVDVRDCASEPTELIISVGAGIGNLRNLELAKEVAERLGAELACSRSVVEKGWMEQTSQIGQTGRSVSPRVYLALGVSGAAQHQVGMSRSKNIIAVNNDPEANIHQIANVSIIGDVGEFLKRLLERLDRLDRANGASEA